MAGDQAGCQNHSTGQVTGQIEPRRRRPPCPFDRPSHDGRTDGGGPRQHESVLRDARDQESKQGKREERRIESESESESESERAREQENDPPLGIERSLKRARALPKTSRLGPIKLFFSTSNIVVHFIHRLNTYILLSIVGPAHHQNQIEPSIPSIPSINSNRQHQNFLLLALPFVLPVSLFARRKTCSGE